MVQSVVNNMSSSLQSSSNENRGYHEEDVSSSHIEIDKPHMSINPSLTQSVASGKKQQTLVSPLNIVEESKSALSAAANDDHPQKPPRRVLAAGAGQALAKEKPHHARVARGLKQGSTSSGSVFVS